RARRAAASRTSACLTPPGDSGGTPAPQSARAAPVIRSIRIDDDEYGRRPPPDECSRDGRLEEGERAGAAVQADPRAEGNRRVDRVVPDGQEADARQVRLSHQVVEHLAEGAGP